MNSISFAEDEHKALNKILKDELVELQRQIRIKEFHVENTLAIGGPTLHGNQSQLKRLQKDLDVLDRVVKKLEVPDVEQQTID